MITDKTLYLAVTPQMRRLLATMAEGLIEMLNEMDGAENLE